MSATISECGTYRYTLERKWSSGTRDVLWVMLNPSTADHEINDPTIRRCIGFSKAWGYDGLMVGNLYAYRATKPADLWDAGDNVDIRGSENDQHLCRMAARAALIVAAWGSGADHRRAVRTLHMLAGFGVVHQLRATKGGMPCHPLYLPGDLTPVPITVYTPPEGSPSRPDNLSIGSALSDAAQDRGGEH
jgi:hypothetical protein